MFIKNGAINNMKSIFYFALGLIAGILTLHFGWDAVKMLFSLHLLSFIVDAFITCGLGLLTIKMFEEI